MGSIFSSPSPAVPPPPPPSMDDPAIADRRRTLQVADSPQRGRPATVLTSGLGERPVVPERPGAPGFSDDSLFHLVR